MEIRENLIREAFITANLDDSALHMNYSGREMYGRTCFGVVGNLRDICKFFVALTAEVSNISDDDAQMERLDLVDELIDHMRQDSMGLESIYYFPGCTLV